MSYVSTDIKKIIAEIIENKKEKGGVKNIYFVGCGGSLERFIRQRHLWKERRRYFVQHGSTVTSLFIVHRRISEKTQSYVWHVIKEIHLRRFRRQNSGKEKGAAVIILTWLEESEIIEFGDYIIRYTFDASLDHLAGDIDYAGEKTQCALLVAVELLAQTEGYENYEKFYEGLGMISNIIKNARKHVAERAEALQKNIRMIR